MSFDDIVQEVCALPVEQRRELIILIVDSLIQPSHIHQPGAPAVLKPDGLSPEIWQEAAPQDHDQKLRIEWADGA